MCETIFKGATRPAVVLGVPLQPALGLVVVGGLLGAWGAFLVSRWFLVLAVVTVVPGIAWMRAVTARDDQRVRQYWHRMLLGLRCPNQKLWGCRSYSATLYRGNRHG